MNRLCILTFLVMQAQSPFRADAKQSYAGIKNTLLTAADKMPEESYPFRTTAALRTYGEIVGHIADTNLRMAKGEQKTGNAGAKTSKADLAAAFKASLDCCDPIYNSITDASGATRRFGQDVPKMYGTAASKGRL